MSERNIGQILWTDLTVGDAEDIRAFYEAVIGWTSMPVNMDGYNDFMMLAPDAPPVKPDDQAKCAGGICHARGGNADLPAQWLNYFGVADLDASLTNCAKLGGEVVTGIKNFGEDRYCVIRDPAGATCALYEQAAK